MTEAVELYADPTSVAHLLASVTSPQGGKCVAALAAEPSGSGPQAKIVGTPEIDPYQPGPSAADLGVDAVTGYDMIFTVTANGVTVPVRLRFVLLCAGRGDATLMLAAGGPAAAPTVDGTDIDATLRAASARLVASAS
jgi:hypothetical protein